MRTTKSVTISLPPAQLRQAERLAKKQSRTMSELFREALRRYQKDEYQPDPRALAQLAETVQLIRQSGRQAGLDRMTMGEINAEVAATRTEARNRAKRPAKRSAK